MDDNNVISLVTDINSLEDEWNQWMMLTYDQRKVSDVFCIQKYGCNNQDLYEILKSKILQNESVDNSKDALIIDKINSAKEAIANDSNIVLINDIVSSDTYTTIDMINSLMDKFNSLPTNYRDLSDSISFRIWNNRVANMYEYVKNKIITRDSNTEMIRKSEEDNLLDIQKKQLEDITIEENYLDSKVKSIMLKNTKSSIYESAVLNKLVDSHKVSETFNFDKYLSPVVPYLTLSEMNLSNDQTIFSYLNIDNGTQYVNTIRQLQEHCLSESNIENTILDLGWNPCIPINDESIKAARERQIKWLEENFRYNVIDLSNYNTELAVSESELTTNDLYPVYIVLVKALTTAGKIIRSFTKSDWSHAAISFDAKLDKMYSYTIANKGFTIENIKNWKYGKNKDTTSLIHVSCIFVTKDIIDKMKKNIGYYIQNQDSTSYNFKNLVYLLFNKAIRSDELPTNLICSQFVDIILKSVGIDITNKSSNLIAPSSFDITKYEKIYVLFRDDSAKYKPSNTIKKINAIKQAFTFDQLVTIAKENVSDILGKYLIENLAIRSDDKELENELSSIRNYISLNEVKSPIGFDEDGDLYISLPKNMQKEYNESHKLLLLYEKGNNINGMKQEICRMFYLNSVIETKLSKMKYTNKNYKTLIDLRARVLNDFNKYFRIIQSTESDFDFYSYFKKTDYYNKTITIDGSTITFTAYYIKKILKIILTE